MPRRPSLTGQAPQPAGGRHGAAGVNARPRPGGGAALTGGACALAPYCARLAQPRRASVGERPLARVELLPPAAGAAPPPLPAPPARRRHRHSPWSKAPAGRTGGPAAAPLDGSGHGAALAYPQRHLQPLRLGESARPPPARR